MPIYEYVCKKCDQEFEELLRSRDEVVKCPGCGTKKVSRRLSIVGFKSGSTFVSASGGGGCGSGSCGGGSCGSCSH
ncbi:MAG: zinc ribbon domain-containing protein [Nitrospirae bacterium]|nr:zinc ribbon domain-containing protein [Nitrospirota bacterium]